MQNLLVNLQVIDTLPLVLTKKEIKYHADYLGSSDQKYISKLLPRHSKNTKFVNYSTQCLLFISTNINVYIFGILHYVQNTRIYKILKQTKDPVLRFSLMRSSSLSSMVNVVPH